jgi:formylglycine-generating enzyme required for sulfatase activity
MFCVLLTGCNKDSSSSLPSPAKRLPEASVPSPPATVTTDPKVPDMVFIPAGEFIMGSVDEEVNADEKPAHKVFVNAFYIDRHEVTNSQYQKFIRATGHPAPFVDRPWAAPYDWNGTEYPAGKGNHPVVLVNWDDAAAFAHWIGKRLPTEAEWEKAARGGLVSKKYPFGDQIEMSHANFDKGFLRENTLQPVASFQPGGYGLYDMAGNVWEWCQDWYDEKYYKASPGNNPGGAAAGVYRVMRGGSWANDKEFLRCAQRGKNVPDGKSHIVGFRCALSAEQHIMAHESRPANP